MHQMAGGETADFRALAGLPIVYVAVSRDLSQALRAMGRFREGSRQSVGIPRQKTMPQQPHSKQLLDSEVLRTIATSL